MFELDDLDKDVFLNDLRQTVTDDLLLAEYLDVTAVRRIHAVRVGGSIRESVERHVRWQQSTRRHDPRGSISKIGVSGLFATIAVLFPKPAAVLLTFLHLGINEALGERRWIPMIAYPAMIAQFLLLSCMRSPAAVSFGAADATGGSGSSTFRSSSNLTRLSFDGKR